MEKRIFKILDPVDSTKLLWLESHDEGFWSAMARKSCVYNCTQHGSCLPARPLWCVHMKSKSKRERERCKRSNIVQSRFFFLPKWSTCLVYSLYFSFRLWLVTSCLCLCPQTPEINLGPSMPSQLGKMGNFKVMKSLSVIQGKTKKKHTIALLLF